MELQKTREWFNEWFDSPYYHLLYKNRDFKEAETFVDNLVKYLGCNPSDKILDLACGRGRHAIHLHSYGLDVTGLDLSQSNIEYASQFSEKGLNFHVHDMRDVFRPGHYDYVFNLFTSFGYFASKTENRQVIKAATENLKPGGIFLIDFMNTHKVVPNLVPMEEKQVDGINFHITRHLTTEGFIEKAISIYGQDGNQTYKERVKAITVETFMECFRNAGLEVKNIFGNYALQPFDKTTSDRMIFLLEK